MNILYITRNYPPTKGGLEKVNYHLSNSLKKLANVYLIKSSYTKKYLPIVLPYFLLKSSYILATRRVDVIHFGDGLLSPLGFLLKKIFNKRVTVTVHGLDITLKYKLYQYIVPRCLSKLDKVICVSNNTKNECIKRGIPEGILTVIPNGIDPDEFYIKGNKKDIRKKLEKKEKIKISDKKIILSVGRLVERKGYHWFIENVMPKLIKERKDILYIIAGEGRYRKTIESAIDKKGLHEYVLLLGKIDDETLKLLYNSADVFVAPNIQIDGDAEGFGVVALEAASCGVPVVANDVDGVSDAIIDGKNGFLIEKDNLDKYAKAIKIILDNIAVIDSKTVKKTTINAYNWETIAKDYLETVEHEE